MSLFGRKRRGLFEIILWQRFLDKRKEDKEEGRSFLQLEKEDRPYVENPNDAWENIYQRNMTKLSLMVLIYAFSEDDDQISKREMSQIKSFFKLNRSYLTNDDYDEIEKLFKTKISQQAFLEHLEKNGYEESILNDAIEKANSLIRTSGKYLLVIDELKKAFQNR
jgi:hypothetical protein